MQIAIKKQKRGDTMLSDYPDVMNVEQVSEALHLCKALVYQLLKSNEIPSKRIGNVYRIPKRYVIEFLCGGEHDG